MIYFKKSAICSVDKGVFRPQTPGRGLAKTEEEHLRIIRYLDERSPEGEAFMISHICCKKID